MRDEITIHLGCIGTPITWSVTAVYGGSLGVAMHAAASWYQHTAENDNGRQSDCPQFICRVRDGKVDHVRLWMDERRLRRQSFDRTEHLVQWHTRPVDVPENVQTLVSAALHDALVEFGYLIPRDEWERRYPAQALISKRFAEFNAAYDAHKASGAEGRMPYEPRWAIMMEAPEGYRHPYDVEVADHDVAFVRERVGRRWRRLDGTWDPETALSRCRLHNGGWNRDEVDVMMRDEPVEA